MKYIFSILLVIGLLSCREAKQSSKTPITPITTTTVNPTVKKVVTTINGTWVFSNETSFTKLIIKNDDDVFFSVMSNQIYIKAKIEKTSNNVYNLYLVKPDDLGPGGVRLAWDDYAKNTEIATITLQNENKLNFNWLGFYNNKTKKREFTECEFNLHSASNPTLLMKESTSDNNETKVKKSPAVK